MRGSYAIMLTAIVLGLVIGSTAIAQSQAEQVAFPGAQRGPVSVSLQHELARADRDPFVRIIVRLKEQLSADARHHALGAVRDGRKKTDRRHDLVKALRAFSKETQVSLRAALAKLEAAGQTRHVRYLWISNVVVLEAKAEAVDALSRVRGVEAITQDIKRPAFQQTPAWGVDQINANDVWTTPGVNGDGVVVAVIDTGADLTHTDLVHNLWINAAEDINHDGQFTAADSNGIDEDSNGYIDDVVGWDFANDDNGPSDWHGHGTHVAGTVAGDGTGGTATGVAPGAHLMILAYSASITAGQAEAWEAMQYALDNGADVVNFSSAWRDSWSPDYATWRDTTDVLTDGGVLFVVAAGNDNPHDAAPGGVFTPARAPRALAVGATDNTDTIASFSGQGPTSWQSVTGYNDYIHPPGLLKPDVSAPGVSVTSTQNGGGYVNGPTWSGTSMAAPHAAGTAALLLDQNAALLPHELMFIIRETAVDLGAAGEDNVYGFGRIDAQAAVTYSYATTPVYDLSVTGTNQLWTTVDIWVDNNDDGTPDDPVANTDNHLYARVRNVGGQAVGNVEVKFYYADVGTIGISGFDPNGDGDPADGNFTYVDSYFVPVMGPVGSSQDTAVAVVKWNVPVPVTDHWCVGIGIVAPDPPNATESNRANNTAFRNFFNIVVTYGQVQAVRFFVHPDPRKPKELFNLEFIREGLPIDFDVQLAVEQPIAEKWFRELRGFERVERPPLKNMPIDPKWALQYGEPIHAYVRLGKDQGAFHRLTAPEGKPVLVTLLLRAPDRPSEALAKAFNGQGRLIINATNQAGRYGGLAFEVRLGRAARAKQGMFVIPVADGFEAELLRQRVGIEAVKTREGKLYYWGDEALNCRLRGLGYEPKEVDHIDVITRIVKVEGKEAAKVLVETGVRILRREPGYCIVESNARQSAVLSRLGLRVRAAGESEARPRRVSILISNEPEMARIAPFLSDHYSTEKGKRGFVVHGTAWDDGIDKLKALGFNVEVGTE